MLVAGVGRRSCENGCLDVEVWVRVSGDAVEQRKWSLEMRR